MLDKTIDRLGDWNPQLFRELKSRWHGTPLVSVVVVSILCQLVLVGSAIGNAERSSVDFTGTFHFLNRTIPIFTILGSVYTLVSDLNREERQGTLNFIHLTPQSARSIFLGKILGVPSLIYLGILLTIPLHFIVGMLAGANLFLLVIWAATIGSIAYFVASLTILYVLNGGKYAILWTLLISLPLNAIIAIYNWRLDATIQNLPWQSDRMLLWFWMPVFNVFLMGSGLICTLLAISYWLWITIDRKYLNPFNTALSKADSYWVNGLFQLWLLGFALPLAVDRHPLNSSDNFYMLSIFLTLGVAGVLLMMQLILPSRASIRDWIHDRRNLLDGKQSRLWHPDLIQDLIWDDRSPVLVAMAIQMAIAAIVWGLCFCLFVSDRELLLKSFLSILMTAILTLIQTIAITFISLRSRVKNIGVIPLIFLMSWLPLFIGILATINQNTKILGAIFLLCSPVSWMGLSQLSIFSIMLVAIGQFGILAGFTKLLTGKIANIANSADRTLDRQKSSLMRTT